MFSSDTEFLTDSGFKSFNDICESDKLATVDLNIDNFKSKKTFGIEFLPYKEKYSSLYTGTIYKLSGLFYDIDITADHQVLMRKNERLSGKVYNWEKREISICYDTFDIKASISPNTKNYSCANIFDFKSIPIPDTSFLSLIGWYLSDGTASFRFNKTKNKNTVNNISISQIKGGKLYYKMRGLYNYNKNNGFNFYIYEKPPNEFNPKVHLESKLHITNKILKNSIVDNCGFTSSKRIPRWAYKLSVRHMQFLLNGLIDGDGSKYELISGIKFNVYYGTSLELMSDVNELSFYCGYTTSLCGPYHYDLKYKKTYQVRINLEKEDSRKFIRSKNVSKNEVKDKEMVGFTTDNNVLIVRNNGYICIV